MQGKKRPREVSPSRWLEKYDKPLPQSILGDCTAERCHICSVDFNGPAMTKSHYDGKQHEKKVTKKLLELFPADDESTVTAPKRMKVENSEADKPISDISSDTYCQICNVLCGSVDVFLKHLEGKSHASKEKNMNGQPDGNALHCKVCNIFVHREQFMAHENGKSHLKKTKMLSSGINLHGFSCALCSVKCTDKQGYESHLIGKRHLENIAQQNQPETSAMDKECSKDAVKGNKGSKNIQNNGYKCGPCQMSFPNEDAQMLHVVGEAHKTVVQKLGEGEMKVVDYSQLLDST